MTAARTCPIIAVVIGEASSGGALVLAWQIAFLSLENSYYSVISPEGCAGRICGRYASRRPPKPPRRSRSPAKDLFELKLVDEIDPVKDRPAAPHNDPARREQRSNNVCSGT